MKNRHSFMLCAVALIVAGCSTADGEQRSDAPAAGGAGTSAQTLDVDAPTDRSATSADAGEGPLPGAGESVDVDQLDALTSESFDDTASLREALEDAGVECRDGVDFTGEGFQEGLRCAGGIWMTTYGDEDSKALKVAEYEDNGSNFVEGLNWIVVAPAAVLGQP